MKYFLFIFSFAVTLSSQVYGQSSISNDSIFKNGVQLSKPDFNFDWNLRMDEIPTDKFINYRIKILTWNRKWVKLRFDSAVFLNQFVLQEVVVNLLKKNKTDVNVSMMQFAAKVDLETLERLGDYFNYKWKGWISFPKENPAYKFKFFKGKKEGVIAIEVSGIRS